jgi:autotransporter-associated beta strand protein
MKSTKVLSRNIITVAAAFAAFSVFINVNAQTTWNGSVDNNWNTPGNWSSGVPDGSSEIVLDGTTQTSIQNVPNLSLNADLNINPTADWTLSGGTITVGSAGRLLASTQVNASLPRTHTINSNLDFGSTNGRSITANSNTSFEINGLISGDTSPSARAILFIPSSVNAEIRLTNDSNSFGQIAHLRNGIVEAATIADSGENSALGAGDTIWFSQIATTGTLRYVGSGSSTNRLIRVGNGNSDTATGGAIILNNGTGALNFTNTTFNGAWGSPTVERAIQFGGSYNGTNVVSGAIADMNAADGGTIAVEVSGSTWQLDGANTYTGATTVSGGTLIINGSTAAGSAVTVATGGTLGGSGTIDGDIVVNSGGTLSPGNSIGKLTVDQLTLEDGANLVFGLTSDANAGITYDQIDGTSLILSGGMVNLILEGVGTQTIVQGDTFTLFTGSVTGFEGTTFNITNNTDWTGGWELSEGSLILTAIPEPTTYGLIAGLLVLGVILLRRRMK